jgi:energy-coupling factor transporter ATP-binding protein EcfA2
MQPEVMLLDEITSALDPELVGEVLDVVRDLKRDGMTMLIATHEMSFAREIADAVCFLHEGGSSSRAHLTSCSDVRATSAPASSCNASRRLGACSRVGDASAVCDADRPWPRRGLGRMRPDGIHMQRDAPAQTAMSSCTS